MPSDTLLLICFESCGAGLCKIVTLIHFFYSMKFCPHRILYYDTKKKLNSKPGLCITNCIDGYPLHEVGSCKYPNLILTLDSELTFKPHLNGRLLKSPLLLICCIAQVTVLIFCGKRMATLLFPIINYCDVVLKMLTHLLLFHFTLLTVDFGHLSLVALITPIIA